MNNLLNLTWKVAVARGVLGIVFGLLLVISPLSAVVFLIMWGVWLLFDAIGWFTTAFAKGQPASNRAMSILLGVLALLVAFFAIFRPGITAATLVLFVGIWLIVRGVGGALVGITQAKGGSRWLILLGAALDILLGVLFFLNPLGSAVVIVLFIGITLIVWGIVFVALGLMLRKRAKRVADLP